VINRFTPARIAAVQCAMAPFLRFVSESFWRKRSGDPAASDLVFGNPNEMPVAGFVDALQHATIPQDHHWFGYKWSEPAAQAVAARALRARLNVPFENDDIHLTTGAFAGISVALNAILAPGDEVIFFTPPWFFYEALILAAGGRPVRVPLQRQTFDLDLAALAAALTPRTRAVIVNSPQNPTGRIYSAETLERLAQILSDAAERLKQPISILSDEAYSRIVFDGRACSSPAQFYSDTIVIYTYGKTLLTPGERIGYLALTPTMPDRERIRTDLFTAQLTTGFAFPNALLQHALGDLETLSIDIATLQRRRDRLVSELHRMRYEVHVPEGTFYLLAVAPGGDDMRFCEVLAAHNVFCLPGSIVELPGYFRLSLTATDAMIERALDGFASAIAHVRARDDGKVVT
jgi:aspartate aminotransferase